MHAKDSAQPGGSVGVSRLHESATVASRAMCPTAFSVVESSNEVAKQSKDLATFLCFFEYLPSRIYIFFEYQQVNAIGSGQRNPNIVIC